MRVKISTAPTVEPVTLAEAKDHLGIDTADTSNDDKVTEMIVIAREHVEDVMRRALISQTWQYYLCEWPKENYISLPFGNLRSAPTATPPVPAPIVTYKDTDGVSTTIPSTDYIVELNGEGIGRIVLAYGCTWPSTALYPSNPITVQFVCGWEDAAAVPSRAKAAIKLLCADMFENRGERILGQTVVENRTVENLLWPLRLWGCF